MGAFDGILKVVAETDAKKKKRKKDLEACNAYDNFVSALFFLLKHQKQHCKDPVAAWNLVLSKLPLKHDEDEARKVAKAMIEMLKAQNADLLGPNNANFGKVLGVMSELHKSD